MKLIAISAPKGSGKTTFADFIKKDIQDKYQKRVAIRPFAAPLKDVCWRLFGGEHKNWYGSDINKNVLFTYWRDRLGEKYSTPRRILQTFGTEVMREAVSQTFWLDVFSSALRNSIEDVVIVDDLRFENEAQYVRNIGGRIIHLRRDNETWKGGHESELGPTRLPSEHEVNFTNLVDMKLYAATVARDTLIQSSCTLL